MGKYKKLGLGIVIVCILIIIILLIGMSFFGKYDVYFDSQGGIGIPTQQVNNGDKIIKPADPVMEGYLFIGWYLEDELYNFDNKVTKSITLIGKWQSVVEYN